MDEGAFYKLVLASSVNADGSDTFDIIRYENEGSEKGMGSLIDKYETREIDLLSLDIEGYEVEALRGLDMTRHKPKLILIETVEIDRPQSRRVGPWQTLGEERGIRGEAAGIDGAADKEALKVPERPKLLEGTVLHAARYRVEMPGRENGSCQKTPRFRDLVQRRMVAAQRLLHLLEA